MDLRTGMGFQRKGPAPLDAVPVVEVAALTVALEDAGDDGREDLALLRGAATLMTAGQRLEGLLPRLTVDPFVPAMYRGLGSYMVGPGVLALGSTARACASTSRGI